MNGYKKSLSAKVEAYKANVAELEASKFYQHDGRAKHFLDVHLARVWGPVIGADEEESIVDELDMPKTLVRIVHFFARGVLRFKPGKAPPLLHFPPASDEDEYPIRSVAKRDLAKIVGCSQSTVDKSLLRIGGNMSADHVLHRKRILYSLPSATGVMVDVMTCAQMSLYALIEYQAASDYAINQQINTADRTHRTKTWCAEKREGMISNPTADERPQSDAQDDVAGAAE